jgi:hypothetical protein
VDNWVGSAGHSGDKGKIFVGNTLGTLTTGQLSQIIFTGGFPSGALVLIGTGEVVPQPLTPLLVITPTPDAFGTTCFNEGITRPYTITNQGLGTANNVALNTTNPEFAPVALPANTILGPGQTINFNVIFTPVGPTSGSRSAICYGDQRCWRRDYFATA